MNKRPIRGSDLRRAIHFVWHGARGWTILSIVLIIVQGILPPLSLYLMKLLIDAVSSSLTHPHQAAGVGHAERYIILMAAVAFVGSLCTALTNLCNHARSQHLMDHMYDVI